MTSRTLLARLLTVLMLTTLAVTASPTTPAHAVKARVKYANAAVKATNHAREKRDRVKLRRNRCLQRFANRQARWMAEHRQMAHQRLGPIQRRCRMGLVGENVAFGFPGGRAVVRAWLRSHGHRANLLRPRFRFVAVGARKANGVWWVAQVFGRRA